MGLSYIGYVTVHWTSDVAYIDSLCFVYDNPTFKRPRIMYRLS